MGLSKEQRKQQARELCIKEWGFDPALMQKFFIVRNQSKHVQVYGEYGFRHTITTDALQGQALYDNINEGAVLWVQREF